MRAVEDAVWRAIRRSFPLLHHSAWDAGASEVLTALRAAGFAVVPVVAPDCIRNINGSANWSKMIDAIAAAQEDGR